jgi:eukaryotic-like serine/threonine-protein kinase
MALDQGIRIGKYVVGRKLGQGGFGVLHVARDTELDREVAIKFLRPEHAFRPQIVQRFLQEARAAARINHPGIVTVYESGIVGGTNTRADGTVYIAMELLAGETLAERLKAGGRLPVLVAIGMTSQLAAGLAAAHASSIVHRDLKPQNVFLVRDPAVVGGERVKILDFGIAKLVDDFGSNVQTHSMLMLGTPMYMSPEQCKSSAKVDARSDIYALGCMLFELVCGCPPFDGDSGELIAKHQLVPPPAPRTLDATLPKPLDALVLSMLAKSADDRPQTMDAVLDALHAIGASGGIPMVGDGGVIPQAWPRTEPSTTVSENASARPNHELPSRRRLVIAGACAAILLGIGVGLVTVHSSHDDAAAIGTGPAVGPGAGTDAARAIAQTVVAVDAGEPTREPSLDERGPQEVAFDRQRAPRPPPTPPRADCDPEKLEQGALSSP